MKKGYIVSALACITVAGILLILFLHAWLPSCQHFTPPVTSGGDQSDSASISLTGAEPYHSPIDFQAQQEINADIYAWIQIPNTTVDYPVLQHQSDDTYYLNHNIYGKKTVGGALFTERAYNSTDFSDPVTIIYGHKLKSGAMFGSLQALYSDPEGFEQNRTINIWLPERRLEYEIFAALPYDNRHILYNYDFTSARMFRGYFKGVLSIRALGANFDSEYEPNPEDHILILSTCLRGDNTKRYLVMARQVG